MTSSSIPSCCFEVERESFGVIWPCRFIGRAGRLFRALSFCSIDQVKVSVANLHLFQPFIVYQLQDIVKKFPGWEIVYAVTLDDHLKDWPDMGLYIRGDEIIDTLQRQYFKKNIKV